MPYGLLAPGVTKRTPPMGPVTRTGVATPTAAPPSGAAAEAAAAPAAAARAAASAQPSSLSSEVEAALALGFPPRDAVLLVCRPAAGQALIPALDQTRTVGLVTLPGAFVGVLLGGASPLAAGITQLFVLVGLLAVETVAVVATVETVARGLLCLAERAPLERQLPGRSRTGRPR